MITAAHAKEALSRAYLIAVAASARQNLWFGGEFDYGVDGSFKLVEQRGEKLRETGFAFDFQVKASVNWEETGGIIKYDLDAEAYNNLSERAGKSASTPFFLILLCLPKDEATWSDFGSEFLTLRRCAYFLQLKGELTVNSSQKRIEIPLTNSITPKNVIELLKAVKDGTLKP